MPLFPTFSSFAAKEKREIDLEGKERRRKNSFQASSSIFFFSPCLMVKLKIALVMSRFPTYVLTLLLDLDHARGSAKRKEFPPFSSLLYFGISYLGKVICGRKAIKQRNAPKRRPFFTLLKIIPAGQSETDKWPKRSKREKWKGLKIAPGPLPIP